MDVIGIYYLFFSDALQIMATKVKDEIAISSCVHGPYSIPKCLEVLTGTPWLAGEQFGHAVELLHDEQNRMVVMSLKHNKLRLLDWIRYKYARAAQKKPCRSDCFSHVKH
ncbi:hypothetical protein RJT34_30847 [Clitoria ternatea]|uniref:Uncharacterized protein n=1 Tax=Clitoria ternatea TaxID=43366 RepID=A0AAN9I4F6_CLITE